MSEKLRSHENREISHDDLEQRSPEVRPNIPETKTNQEKFAEKQEKLNTSHHKLEEAGANKAEEIRAKFDSDQDKSIKAVFTSKKSKADTRNAFLSTIRTQLSGPNRSFSKFVNNPTIDKSSEALGKTLLRPSGILCGALVTLFGSIYYLYITHSTGFKYNFYIAILLFVGGFLLGLILEAFFRMFAAKDN
jgi:hypothetical protein